MHALFAERASFPGWSLSTISWFVAALVDISSITGFTSCRVDPKKLTGTGAWVCGRAAAVQLVKSRQ